MQVTSRGGHVSDMTVIGRAERMVAQHLDHPAIGNAAARALQHHALQFSLQRRQSRKAAFDLGQLRAGDGIGGGTGLVRPIRQAEQIADGFERKAKVAGMASYARKLVTV